MTSPSILSSPLAAAGSLPSPASHKTASATAGSSASSTASGASSQTSLNQLGSTFLNLLTQELQNQDPTSPMDSTQMVGQMISLNPLDQVASINQLLTNYFGSTGASSTGSASTTAQG